MTSSPDLHDVRAKLATETGLTEVVTIRNNGAPLISVVNAGIASHPGDGHEVVAFVSAGRAARLGHLRRNPRITMAVRRGWSWVGIDGRAELAGPDDAHPAVPADAIPGLLRTIFQAAGGTHADYDEFDRVMAADRRCAVLVTVDRVYGNNPGG
jgi:PPOX class probable F420-dependent enzyme